MRTHSSREAEVIVVEAALRVADEAQAAAAARLNFSVVTMCEENSV